ncbi:MAG: isocitrate/isopropylmalate family dehydrogenase [Vicinamibacterales bacterium]
MAHTITLIPGDGIGPEVTEAVVRILTATGVAIDWERHDAGVLAVEKGGPPLPIELLDSIRRNKVALKGPVTTPVGTGFTSVNVGLRKALDLFANLRPVWNMPGVPSRYDGDRSRNRAREHRGSLRRTRAPGRAGRRREPEDHHGEGVDTHRAIRLRVRAPARAPQGDVDPQGQHHEAQ